MQTVLTIAGFDPSSGAGVTADLMVFAAHRLFGTSAITALTVQSTVGVRATHPVTAEILRETLDCLHADLPPAGIKIGMLATAANVGVVCDYLESLDPVLRTPIVLDPVLRSSSGRELLDPAGVTLLRERLLPLVGWVTPNLSELAILTGTSVTRRDDLSHGARSLQTIVPGSRLGVLAKGGHLDPPDDLLVTPDGEETWLPGRRVKTRSTHGTGCALSSAFLGRLVHGETPVEAAGAAKRYLTEALANAIERGAGSGPMNHLWPLLRVASSEKQ